MRNWKWHLNYFINFWTVPVRYECESTCIKEGPPPLGFHIESCLLAPIQGPCRDFSTRYFYHAEAKNCQMFGYGGCAGNNNNFRTKSACDKLCAGAEAKVSLTAAVNNHRPNVKKPYLFQEDFTYQLSIPSTQHFLFQIIQSTSYIQWSYGKAVEHISPHFSIVFNAAK